MEQMHITHTTHGTAAEHKNLLNRMLRDPILTKILGNGSGEISLTEIEKIFDRAIANIQKRIPGISALELYSKMAALSPNYVSHDIQERVLEAAKNDDPAISALGKKILIYLNIGTIFRSAKQFFGEDEEKNLDMLHSGIEGVLESLPSLKSAEVIRGNIHNWTKHHIAKFLATAEDIPINAAVLSVPGNYLEIRDMV